MSPSKSSEKEILNKYESRLQELVEGDFNRSELIEMYNFFLKYFHLIGNNTFMTRSQNFHDMINEFLRKYVANLKEVLDLFVKFFFDFLSSES